MKAALGLALMAVAVAGVNGSDVIYSYSASKCPVNTSTSNSVNINSIAFQYYRANNSIVLSLNLSNTASDVRPAATLYLNAYGKSAINERFDICSGVGALICPLSQFNLSTTQSFNLSQDFADSFPTIAWNLPDIEAVAILDIENTANGERVACAELKLTNGATSYQRSVSIISGLVLFVALLSSLFYQAVGPGSAPARWRVVNLATWFQHIVLLSFLSLNYPTVFYRYASNFNWSFFLIGIDQVTTAIDNLRSKTGGSLPVPGIQGLDYTSQLYSPWNLNQNVSVPSNFNVSSYLSDNIGQLVSLTSGLRRRADADIVTSLQSLSDPASNPVVQPGIPTYLSIIGLGTPNAFMNVFLVFLMLLAIYIFLSILDFLLAKLLPSKRKMNNSETWSVGSKSFIFASFTRLVLMSLLPVAIFCFVQWDIGRDDAWVPILLSAFLALCFVLFLAFAAYVAGAGVRVGKNEGFNAIAEPYKQLDLSTKRISYKRYFYLFPVLATVVRSVFIVFAVGHPYVQLIPQLVIDVLLLLLVIAIRPFRNKRGNFFEAFLIIMRLVTWALLFIFIPSLNYGAITRAIIGFVLLAITSLVVLLIIVDILWNILYGCLGRNRMKKRNEKDLAEFFDGDDIKSPEPTALNTVQAAESGLIVEGSPASVYSPESDSNNARNSQAFIVTDPSRASTIHALAGSDNASIRRTSSINPDAIETTKAKDDFEPMAHVGGPLELQPSRSYLTPALETPGTYRTSGETPFFDAHSDLVTPTSVNHPEEDSTPKAADKRRSNYFEQH